MNGCWVGLIRRRASSSSNHATRSISANRSRRPERGGHSTSKSFERAVGRVEVALDRPGVDDLAALLDDRARARWSGAVRVERRPGLFLELAPRDRRQRLVGAVRLTLRDRPVAEVPVREIRPAGVGQEHLEAVAGVAGRARRR